MSSIRQSLPDGPLQPLQPIQGEDGRCGIGLACQTGNRDESSAPETSRGDRQGPSERCPFTCRHSSRGHARIAAGDSQERPTEIDGQTRHAERTGKYGPAGTLAVPILFERTADRDLLLLQSVNALLREVSSRCAHYSKACHRTRKKATEARPHRSDAGDTAACTVSRMAMEAATDEAKGKQALPPIVTSGSCRRRREPDAARRLEKAAKSTESHAEGCRPSSELLGFAALEPRDSVGVPADDRLGGDDAPKHSASLGPAESGSAGLGSWNGIPDSAALLSSLVPLSILETESLLHASGKVLRLLLSAEKLGNSCISTPSVDQTPSDVPRRNSREASSASYRKLILCSGGERRCGQAAKGTKVDPPRGTGLQGNVTVSQQKRISGSTNHPRARELSQREQTTGSADSHSGDRSSRRARSRTLRYCTSTTFLPAEWSERHFDWSHNERPNAEITVGVPCSASSCCVQMSKTGVRSCPIGQQGTTVAASVAERHSEAKAETLLAFVSTAAEDTREPGEADEQPAAPGASPGLLAEQRETEPRTPPLPDVATHIAASAGQASVSSGSPLASSVQKTAACCREETQQASTSADRRLASAYRPALPCLSPFHVLAGPESPTSDSSPSPSPLTPPVPQMEDARDGRLSLDDIDTRAPLPGSTTEQSLPLSSDELLHPTLPPQPLPCPPVPFVPPPTAQPDLSTPAEVYPFPEDAWQGSPPFQVSTASAFCSSTSMASLRRRRHASGMRSDSAYGFPCPVSFWVPLACTSATPQFRSRSPRARVICQPSRRPPCHDTTSLRSGTGHVSHVAASPGAPCSPGWPSTVLFSPQAEADEQTRRDSDPSIALPMNGLSCVPPETRKTRADCSFPAQRVSPCSHSSTPRSVSKSTREGTTTSTASDDKGDGAPSESLLRLSPRQGPRQRTRRIKPGAASLFRDAGERQGMAGGRQEKRLCSQPEKRPQSNGEIPPAQTPKRSRWDDDIFHFEERSVSARIGRPSSTLMGTEENGEGTECVHNAHSDEKFMPRVEDEMPISEVSTKVFMPYSQEGRTRRALSGSKPLEPGQEMETAEIRKVSGERREPSVVGYPACRVVARGQAQRQTGELPASGGLRQDPGRTDYEGLPASPPTRCDSPSKMSREDVEARSVCEQLTRKDSVGEWHEDLRDGPLSFAGRDARTGAVHTPTDTPEHEARHGSIREGLRQERFLRQPYRNVIPDISTRRRAVAEHAAGTPSAAYRPYCDEFDLATPSLARDVKSLSLPKCSCEAGEGFAEAVSSGDPGWKRPEGPRCPQEEKGISSPCLGSDRARLLPDSTQKGDELHALSLDRQPCCKLPDSGVRRRVHDSPSLRPWNCSPTSSEDASDRHPTSFYSMHSAGISEKTIPLESYGEPRRQSAGPPYSRKRSGQSALTMQRSAHAGESPISRARLRRRAAALFRELVRAEALQPDAAEALRIAVQRQLYDAKPREGGSTGVPLSSEEEELRHCTFRPQINQRRSARCFLSNVPWWQRLYNGYRVPDMKRELQLLQEHVEFMTRQNDDTSDAEDDRGGIEQNSESPWGEASAVSQASGVRRRCYSDQRKLGRRSSVGAFTRVSRDSQHTVQESMKATRNPRAAGYVPTLGHSVRSPIALKGNDKQPRKCVRFASPTRSPQACSTEAYEGKIVRAKQSHETLQSSILDPGRPATGQSRILTSCLTKPSVARGALRSKSQLHSPLGNEYSSAGTMSERAKGLGSPSAGSSKEPYVCSASSPWEGYVQRSRTQLVPPHAVSCPLRQQHESWLPPAPLKKSYPSLRGILMRQSEYPEWEGLKGILRGASRSTYTLEDRTEPEESGSRISKELLKTYLGGRNFVPGWLDVH
ncbi:conserved hypothetical protein [Neospora caninum Liverpool]|uniref:Uncharacterized protein n=1 Tax=Neospora caninum (strain Liverpool) TaxID=572307 RepID=F0V9G2_NEOCL|nr:conserved hypothetical protein [Neospora caninum Liverpool]CBZ50387.1 conserved hypothetical protein [Neospora caninum Liverpool]CEL64995.1 TPA: hypothetical protein BN1204_008560 [Neospora caninum Liverpool]|eukprot:XP_003880421.1 conserved hypothetical protein [Neospora caninum Liverpool]